MGDGTGYVCTLRQELIDKARIELNETPENRTKGLAKLREKLSEHRELHVRTDDLYLLRFLRARKFDVDRAFELIETHYKVKKESPELYDGLRPSAIKHVMEDGVIGVLDHRDREGRKVLVFRPGRWDPDRYSMADVVRSNFVTLSKLVQDEETQINGVISIIDHGDVGWKHVKNLSPSLLKKDADQFQGAFPLRLKALHFINEPSIFDYIFSILKPFLREKTLKRLQLHGHNYEKLAEAIDPDILPEDFGGKAPKYSNKNWADFVLGCDAEFDEEGKYGIVDGTIEHNKKDQDAMDRLTGTYRKLNVD